MFNYRETDNREVNHQPLFVQAIETRLGHLSKTWNTLLSREPGMLSAILAHGSDRIAEYKKIFAQVCRNEHAQRQLVDEINDVTHQETMEFLDAGHVSADILIIGSGPAGVSFASRIRKKRPNANIIMLDERDYRGGQFADEGYDYELNSPQMAEKLGFAGELMGRNNLGEDVFLQLENISDEHNPARKKLATVLQVDGFVVAPAIVDTKMMEIVVTDDPHDPYQVKAFHKGTEKDIVLHPKIIIFAGGQGRPKYSVDMTNPDTQEAFQKRNDKIAVADTFSEQLEHMSPEEVLQMIQEGTALIGGRDSANVAVEEIIHKLLRIMSPEEIQKLRLDIFGARYLDQKEFEMSIGTDRYNELLPYIGTFIHAHREKAENLFVGGRKKVGIRTHVTHSVFGHVIMVTGYHDEGLEKIVSGKRQYHRYDVKGQGELRNETIAQRIGHQNIFIVGVAAKETYTGKIPRFARSIARHTPKVLMAADHVIGILDNAEQKRLNHFPHNHFRRDKRVVA